MEGCTAMTVETPGMTFPNSIFQTGSVSSPALRYNDHRNFKNSPINAGMLLKTKDRHGTGTDEAGMS